MSLAHTIAPARPLTGLTFHLPLPPSVNRLTARLGNSSNVVQRWWRHCDRVVLADKRRIMNGAVHGPFALHIMWCTEEMGHSDIDNRVKVLMDYLQRIELIDNDSDCRFLTVCFGDAPVGCKVYLKAWSL